MGCSSSSKKRPNYKSCVRYYNNTSQPLPANATTQVVINGARVVDTGVSIDTQPSSYTITTKGLYHLSGDVVIAATAVGIATVAIYMDGVMLPCTYNPRTLYVGNNTFHVETDLDIESCCCSTSKTITFVITTDATATGTILHVCTGITKIA